MAGITTITDLSFEDPTLIEGLPGVGLVGKIAADHLIDTFEMTYFGAVRCEGLAPVAVYHEDESTVKPPVRLYGDPEQELVVLHSDVPIAAETREEFASCLVGWLEHNGMRGVFLSGLPHSEGEESAKPETFGVATGGATNTLENHGIATPNQTGVVSGPTGALLHEAMAHELDAIGLVVEANPQFPDPRAARALLEEAIGPIAGVEIDTSALDDQAEEIRSARQRLAKRMQQSPTEESSQAQPLPGFQ